MSFVYTPYILPYVGTVILNLLMIFYVSKNLRRNGVIAFVITLIFTSIWSISAAMDISVTSLSLKQFWGKVGFPAYTFGPLAWTIMALQITDWHHWINRKRVLILCVIPVITVLLVWTNDFHGLIWLRTYIGTEGTVHPLMVEHGLWFWIHAVYSDGLNLFSVFMTIH